MWQTLRKLLASKRPGTPPDTSRFQDSDLGTLTFVGHGWKGQGRRNGKGFAVTLRGGSPEPDARLVENARRIIQKLPELEQSSLTYLKARVPGLPDFTSWDFTLHSLTVVAPDRPMDFEMEWLADGDDSCVWKVAFQNGAPHRIGIEE